MFVCRHVNAINNRHWMNNNNNSAKHNFLYKAVISLFQHTWPFPLTKVTKRLPNSHEMKKNIATRRRKSTADYINSNNNNVCSLMHSKKRVAATEHTRREQSSRCRNGQSSINSIKEKTALKSKVTSQQQRRRRRLGSEINTKSVLQSQKHNTSTTSRA